jgi:threonine dehydrogenase-like Zn-dependent dehydrogenase
LFFHGVGDIRLDNVPEPTIQQPTDAIIRLTSSAICGTDLHMIRGTFSGMKPGTILGHEGVGIVEKIGSGVRNLNLGDRVVVPSTIACGYCSYCRGGYHAQCDNANPNGAEAGTAFFGGPAPSGPFNGLQAEFARIPYANTGLVKLPEEVDDDRAITKYIPKLVEMVRCGAIDPKKILTQIEPMTSAIDAYKAFDRRQAGWMKVELVPGR